jgi:uncharacterized protein (DUF1778 family)
MADTLTIRLEQLDRDVLERAARERGLGLSGFVRSLAEAEAERLRREMIRTDGDRVVSYLLENPQARAELDAYGLPQTELP